MRGLMSGAVRWLRLSARRYSGCWPPSFRSDGRRCFCGGSRAYWSVVALRATTEKRPKYTQIEPEIGYRVRAVGYDPGRDPTFAISRYHSYMVGDLSYSTTQWSNRMAPEQPHSEPEIIPPGYSERTSMRSRYRFVDLHGSHRIYAVRLGPFGFASLALVIVMVVAVLATVMFLVLLGAVLLWVPIVILLIAGTIISALLRR